jgi:two-component system sensor histidine kinase ChiS
MNVTPAAQSLPSDILIVDDTPANLHLLARILNDQGYKVRMAPNGKLALMGVRAAPPDLILLDINMPEMDGYQVCQQIKANPLLRGIPIIFISALDQIDDKVKAFTAGGVDYITKPFQMEEVLARVQTHLTLRSLQKDLEQANATLEQRVEARTAELVRLNAAAQRFVPGEFLSFLKKESIAEISLGDQVQGEMTIMFSDIFAFTSMSERMTPQESFDYLNGYLRRVSPIVRQHHGFIDKYLGDGVMSIFPECADDAVQAALEIQQEVVRHNQELQSQGRPALKIGAGLHTGKLMLGIIGEAERLQGTVISDAVNLASRLEELTRTFDAAIIISEQTLQQLRNPEVYPTRFLDRVQVKGKQIPISVYAVGI